MNRKFFNNCCLFSALGAGKTKKPAPADITRYAPLLSAPLWTKHTNDRETKPAYRSVTACIH